MSNSASSVEDSNSPPLPTTSHASVVRHSLGRAREYMTLAITELEAAIAAACYLTPTLELLRQLHIVRTQAQTADLWAASAESHVPKKVAP